MPLRFVNKDAKGLNIMETAQYWAINCAIYSGMSILAS